jgi:(E)-2-((N-methylformamido)methylene)succinate hydrolase
VIVLLHGVGLDHTIWDPVIERLRAAGLEDIVAEDLPGHGGHRIEGPASLRSLAPELTQPCHLVGFSLGGLIATRIAADRPDLVQSLTLVATVANRNAMQRAAVEARMAAATADFGASVDAALDRWGCPRGGDVERIMRANDVPSYLAAYRVFCEADPETWPLYPSLAMPVLAITGADDAGSTPAMTEAIAAAVPDGRAVIVPGARHLVMLDAPDAVADAIISNVRRAGWPSSN